jgi:cytochrome oxidase assembly protein ShyY1
MSADLARWRGEPTSATVSGYLIAIQRGGHGPVSAHTIPHAVRRLDLDSLEQRLPYPIAPYTLVATDTSPGSPDSVPARVPPPVLDDGPHLGYALQWFAFALIGLVGAGVGIRADRRRGRSGGRHHALT